MGRPEGAEVDDEQDVANTGYALQGVKFRAMSALGPSGARPEHLRKLVAVRDRRVASLLLAAVGRFVRTGVAGELCDAARWLLRSRLVFLRKKSGPKPRPIRIGDLWRRVIAKRLVDANREAIQRVCLAARQFGVAVPGGSEGLVHFRVALEKHLGKEALEALAVIDVDFCNAFPSLSHARGGGSRLASSGALDALVPRCASSRLFAVWG